MKTTRGYLLLFVLLGTLLASCGPTYVVRPDYGPRYGYYGPGPYAYRPLPPPPVYRPYRYAPPRYYGHRYYGRRPAPAPPGWHGNRRYRRW